MKLRKSVMKSFYARAIRYFPVVNALGSMYIDSRCCRHETLIAISFSIFEI